MMRTWRAFVLAMPIACLCLLGPSHASWAEDRLVATERTREADASKERVERVRRLNEKANWRKRSGRPVEFSGSRVVVEGSHTDRSGNRKTRGNVK